MNELLIVPDNLIFSPCKVDGYFWREFQTLLSYLGQPEQLYELSKTNSEAYAELISCLVLFVKETENELNTKGLLKPIDLDQLK